ncbi:MAG TPA: ribonuclease R [Chthoniobacterales bacterium]|nr:ribonuclease R [Chthoniobacterales bacterium]
MRSQKDGVTPLRQRLLHMLANPRYQPLNKTDLAKRLGVPINGRSAFRRLLTDLEKEGKIARIRKERYVLPQEADLIVGILQMNPQGFAYVLNGSGDGLGDVYVSAENTSTAMHRDKVVARIIREEVPQLRSGRQRARRQGKVIKILERANKQIVGTLQQSKKFFYVVPDDPCLLHDIYVELDQQRLARAPRINDKVVVRLEEWESRHLNPEGEIIEVLGPARAPGVDILGIIKKYDLPVEFPAGVLEQAEKIPLNIPPPALSRREDLRTVQVFTIDPEDARDFDDAIHIRRFGDQWEVGVHIADVSHYVVPGSALDREAYKRGNSVYLPDRVLPMLPERLSNGVCSLRPDEDHLTKSVIIRFDQSGRLKSHRFAATVIRSRFRLTYREAYERLQRPPENQLDHFLHQAWRIASALRKRRFSKGALELDFPEVRVRVDQSGKAIGLIKEENDISHQLIEEFMLLANEIVGRETKNRSLPSVYRVHEDPDPEKLLEFRELARSHGLAPGDISQKRELQRFLKAIAGRADEGLLKVSLLRSLRKAIYLPTPLGHFGLAKSDYTHFTSPIRRYADLIVHRAFDALLSSEGNGPRKKWVRSSRLEEVCEHVSTTERIAADAEREATRLKKLEYLESLIGRPHRFQATVVEVRNYGLVVEVPDALITGLIHVSSLGGDFFVYDGAKQQIYGRRTRFTIGLGDLLEVGVARVDRFKQQVDFTFVRKVPRPVEVDGWENADANNRNTRRKTQRGIAETKTIP